MTVDERLEFLLKSTESLHETVHELSGQVTEHTKQLQIDAQNIRSLARVAESHEQRLSNLEDGEQG